MIAVPHSAGTARPRLATPPGACDAHIHVYDRRFASIGDPARALAEATAGDYRKLQQRLGTGRAVVVTPTVYGTDNAVTLDAIEQLGRTRTRGVAVLHPEVSDATLHTLDAGGVRGIRFTLFDPTTSVTRFDMVEPLARRITPFGWHVQLHWRADQIVEHAALLARLPCTMVFDHMARLPHPEGATHAAFGIVAGLVDAGRAWVKLSGGYLDPGRPDSRAGVVKAWVRHAPQRLVWGSDWPHPTEKTTKPDDAALLDEWAGRVGDAALCRRILVDNAAELYGF
ncbi:amidohydrolase family protein [Xylophilus sp. Kf1]|nr:amidohydrolase family protein [Xylophilus sp. Kf1]